MPYFRVLFSEPQHLDHVVLDLLLSIFGYHRNALGYLFLLKWAVEI